MPEQTTQSGGGDPSGVPRPFDPERINPARNNSGIMVGEVQNPQATTQPGVQQDQYKTAFIKVYQDAGVIGVAMLTMLALCVLMALFSSRLLKMYVSVTESQASVNKTYADAIERITKAVLITDANVKSATAEVTRAINDATHEIRREHDEQQAELRRLSDSVRDMEGRGARAFDVIIAAVTGPSGTSLRPTPRTDGGAQ